jgi:protein-S-isoprenylcysteine O-methyltransferase Ste14
VGVPLIVLGILFVIAPARKFDVAGTTIKPFQESTALVTSGFFAVSRNPMYLGMTLMLAGIAMLLRSASPFVVVLAFPIVIDRRFIVFEEQSLERTFGADFRQYKARVRRWL